jgi:hypothetical protein
LTSELLWKQLSDEGLVSGDMPAQGEAASPWPVRVMLGIAGWLGALFLLGFAGVAFAVLFKSAEAALPAGFVCCLAAYGIFRGLPNSDFFGQFGFAISVAGQSLLTVGMNKLAGDKESSAVFLAMAAVEALLAFVIPNYVHRVFTTLAANVFLLIALADMGFVPLAGVIAAIGVAVVWRNLPLMAKRPSLWEPIGYGFAIALLHIDGTLLFTDALWNHLKPAIHIPWWAAPIATGLVFIYVVWELRERAAVAANSAGGLFVMVAALVIAVAGLFAPGIVAAVLVIVLGFANGKRVLMGLGLLAFAFYLSHFYYQLSSTLLTKSVVLAATGVCLLGLRSIMRRAFHA